MTISVAEEATTSLAGDNRACSNGRNREDKRSGDKRVRGRTEYGSSSKMGPLCYGGR